MRLDEILLDRPLAERFALDAEAGVLYIDLDGYRVRRTEREVEAVREAVAPRGSRSAARSTPSSATMPA